MKTEFAIVLFGAFLPLASCGGSAAISGGSSGSGGTATTPAWTSVTVPSMIGTSGANGASYNVEPDGYLYAEVYSETLPNNVNFMLRTSATNPGTWTDITGAGLSNPAELMGAMGMTSGGTILVTVYPAAGGIANVFAWNGSTTSPVWTKVTGWNGVSSSLIYGFTNDSAGNTYFSPAYSGDIWRNSVANPLNFTRVQANLYGVTNGGGPGHPNTGGIYAMSVFNLNDGKGDMIWACGEGELDNIALSFAASTNIAYLTAAEGYTGNCTAIDKSATTILAIRGGLNSIPIATANPNAPRTTTLHTNFYPRTPTGFPGHLDDNLVDTLHWVSGTNWILNDRDSATTLTYLLLSTDDGNTWTDMTAVSGINSSCQGANLSIGAVTTSALTSSSGQYIYARCQNGAVLWRYGPLS